MSKSSHFFSWLSTTLVAFAVLFAPRTANGWFEYCHGNAVVQYQGAWMLRDTCNIPDGSLAAYAYAHAGDRWWKIQQVLDYNHTWNSLKNGSCWSYHGDGTSTTMLVTQATLDQFRPGTHGITIPTVSRCKVPYYNEVIVEADVMMLDTFNYGSQDASFWNWTWQNSGEVGMLHEFGHALGDGLWQDMHDDYFDIMRSAEPYPLAGRWTSEPFPLESWYVNQAYYNKYNMPPAPTNWFATAVYFNGTNICSVTDNFYPNIPGYGPCMPASPPPIHMCRGWAIGPIYWARGNNGGGTFSGTARAFLSTFYQGDGPQYTVSQGPETLTGYSTNRTAFDLYIPTNLANGLYFVFMEVDSGYGLTEYDESDNIARLPFSIRVDC
jgi:hypothetical protein